MRKVERAVGVGCALAAHRGPIRTSGRCAVNAHPTVCVPKLGIIRASDQSGLDLEGMENLKTKNVNE